MQLLRFPVPADCSGMRLYVFLRTMGVSATCIKTVKYHGKGFFASGEPIHTDQKVQQGQQITFELPPEPPTDVQAQQVPFRVAYEDEFAAVLDKTAGIAVHPTLNHPDGTLANGWIYLLAQRGQTGVFRPVNRIDKNTSGLVLCAQNAFAAPLLSATVRKCYLALVEGSLPLGPGRIDAPIARRGDSIIGRCVREDGKPSVTAYTVLAASPTHSLAACFPLTGRTHQIRVHFSWQGHPLAGDTLYGGHEGLMTRHALHCAVLRFRVPISGEERRVQSPLPPDFSAACVAAGLPAGAQIGDLLQTVLPVGADPAQDNPLRSRL